MNRLALLLLLLTVSVNAQERVLHAFAYHDVRDYVVEDIDPDQYAISTANLIDQLSWIRQMGYQPVSADQIIDAYRYGKPLPEKAILLSFDDGLASVYTRAFPLLKQFGYPAIVSVVTDWIESDVSINYNDRTLTRRDFLDWEQIRQMQASGLIEIASHSHDMHRGIKGNPQNNKQPGMVTRMYQGGGYEDEDSYKARIEADIKTSISTIETNTGIRPRIITWPYGAYNDTAANIAADLGMRVSLTLDSVTRSRNGTLRVGRNLIVANPGLRYFTAEILRDDPEMLVRAAQIDLDYVYDEDPAQMRRNLDTLLDRVKALQISHVFLQAFADPDGDGGADALYFPNRHLPVRADIFNRVAWQLSTRANVFVFAWLPILSYTGGPFDADNQVLQYVDDRYEADQAGEPRLSPFDDESSQLILDIYEDLAVHANFGGLLFHDDGRLNELEDWSESAMAEYRRVLGDDITPEKVAQDTQLKEAWTELKTTRLVEFTAELKERVKHHRPNIKTARNLFASGALDENSAEYLAQDFRVFLAHYDYVALMAMPGLEGAENAPEFYQNLVAAANRSDPGLRRTIFELQTTDWNDRTKVDSGKIADTMRLLRSLGVRHLAYYPDDFVEGHPELKELRRGMSLAVYPMGLEL